MWKKMPMPVHKPMPNDTMDGNGITITHVQHVTFFWGKDFVMWFNDWPNGKLGMYILALGLVLVVPVAVEVLTDFDKIRIKRSPFKSALAKAVVYGLRMALAYIAMLSVMSYNVGVFISAVVGHAFGYFLVKYRAALKA